MVEKPRALSNAQAMWVLAISLFAEFCSATVQLALVLDVNDFVPIQVAGLSAIPRALLLFGCSYAVAPGLTWWTQWRKIDRILVGVIGSELAYVFTGKADISV